MSDQAALSASSVARAEPPAAPQTPAGSGREAAPAPTPDPAQDWRESVRRVRGWRLLACPNPNTSQVQRWSRRRDEEDLNIAAQLPDHSPSGRAAALEALTARGFRPRPIAVTAPSFLKPRDARAGRAMFGEAGRSLRRFSGWTALLAMVATLAAFWLGGVDRDAALARAAADGRIVAADYAARGVPVGAFRRFGDDLAAGLSANGDAQSLRADTILATARGFGLLTLGGLAVWALATAGRRRPGRVLLLTDEGSGRECRRLERFAAREFGGFGHVFFLAPKSLRRSRFAWTGGAFGAVGLWSAALTVLSWPLRLLRRVTDKARYGGANVASARDYRALARRLRDRIGLNFEAALGRGVFLVRATPAWSDETAHLMLRSSDVVLAVRSEDSAEIEAAAVAAGVRDRLVWLSEDAWRRTDPAARRALREDVAQAVAAGRA
jgi:hypothetical protein